MMPKRLTGGRLRSAVLRTYVDWSDRPRHVLSRRRGTVATTLAVVLAVAVSTQLQLLPLSAGYALYWAHDRVALPFWGYTWTFFSPYSAVWWSLAAICTVVWMVTFVTRWSAVRRPHTRLCRLVIIRFVARSDQSHRFVARLVTGIEWLARRGLVSELLVEVAQLEQTNALRVFIAHGGSDQELARRLVRVTNLFARLRCGGRSTRVDKWWAAAVWHQTLMWIEMRGARVAVGGDVLTRELLTTGNYVVGRLGEPKADSASLPDRLIGDLQRVVTDLGVPPGTENSPQSPVLGSASQRLDEIQTLAEHIGSDWRTRRGSVVDFEADTEDPELLEVLGVIAMSIGLYAALGAGSPSLAMAYVSAFEALRFLQYLVAESHDVMEIARGLSGRAPVADHYRFAGELAASNALRLENAPGISGPIFHEAIKNEWSTVEALNDAAGPDFGGRLSPTSRSGQVSARWVTEDRGDGALIQHRLTSRPIPLVRRTDPILIAGVLGSTAMYAAVLVAFILTFVPIEPGEWTHRPLADNRILENVRRELPARPFLDAVFHPPDREIVISQTGGTFHSFNPDTRVWSTDRPFASGQLARPDVRLLTSAPEGSARAALWGVTVDGGLVRRRNHDWEVVIPDATFLGRDGRPVQHKDLTAVAASPDGRWLVVGAGAAGLGIQDLRHRRWLAVARTPGDKLTSVSHVVWWNGRFFVGGADGVTELTVNPAPVALRRVTQLPGAVMQLESTLDDGLFVLQRLVCSDGSSDCVRLSVLRAKSAEPVVLIDATNRYPGLTLAGSFYAEQWNDHLVIAGEQGVFNYDTRLRSWHQQTANPVSAVGPCKGVRCFYFGYTGGVGRLTPKTLAGEASVHWTLPDERPSRIAADGSGPVAVLTAAGNAFALADKGDRKIIFAASSSNASPERFQNAVTFGDKVLFFGAPGALVHDISERSLYRPAGVPAWLQSPASIVTTSGSRLFGLEPQGDSYLARILTQQQVEAGNLVFTLPPVTIQGPIGAIDPSSANVLRVIDGQGRVISVGDAGLVALTGGRTPDMDRARLLDVTGPDDALAVSTTKGVRLYSGRARAWGNYLDGPPGERPVEVAHRSGTWYARSDADRLITLGSTPSTLVGGYAYAMPDGRPDDVLSSGSDVYLAWGSAIQRYDTRSRGIASMWRIEGGQRVRLKAVVNGEPLSLQGEVARLGSREIARDVHNLFLDGDRLWLTRQEQGKRYLQLQPIATFAPHPTLSAATPECLFRNPTAGPDVTELRDARRLPNGVIAVTTNAGLRFYSPLRRSWYSSNVPATFGRGDLYALGSVLVLADSAEHSTTLHVFRSTIDLPASCSSEPVRLRAPADVLQVRALAVDETAKRAIAIRSDGAVDELTENHTKRLLDSPTSGPPVTEIIRSWHFPDVMPSALWFTTGTHVWGYDITRRKWSRVEVVLDGAGRLTPGTTIDLQPLASSIVVVAKRPTGDFYTGLLPVSAGGVQQVSVTLSPLFTSSSAHFDAEGGAIVDVQQDNDTWVFLLQYALKRFNPRTRMWQTLATFDPGDSPVSYGRVADRGVVTATTTSGQTVWWVEVPDRSSRRYLKYDENPGLSLPDETMARPNPPLDVGWLKWDRSAQTFLVRTPERVIQYSKQDFVRQRRLLFEGVDAVRALGDGHWQTANAAGIWGFPDPDLNLNASSVQFWPVPWSGRIESTSGWFRVEGEEYATVDGWLDRRPASHMFEVGSVTFFKEVRKGMLALIRNIDAHETSAYTNGLFLWDSARKAISFSGNDVLLLSDAGLHSISTLASFDGGPPGNPETGDWLQSGPDLQARFLRGGRWYHRSSPGLWDPIAAGTSDAVVATYDGLEWIRRRGMITVEQSDGSRRTSLIARSNGLGLISDRLLDAAPYQGEAFLVSEASVDIARLQDTNGSFAVVARLPTSRVDGIDRVAVSGDERLFVKRGESVSSWNPRARSFDAVPPEANPYSRRVLAVVGPLRFTLQDGTVHPELQVEHFRNGRTWISVEPQDGRFPFDAVRFVAARNNRLMIGTAAGLQTYSDTNLGLQNAKLFAFGGAQAEPIDRIGEPCSAPGLLVACGSSGCFQESAGGTFAPTNQPDPLSCRIRARSALWSWTADANGIAGRYLLRPEPRGSSHSDDLIELREGRFPHDDIQQVASFDSKIFTIWRGNHVGVHEGSSLAITAASRNHVFADAARLVLISQPVPMAHNSEVDLAPALYVAEGPRLWRYAKGAWLSITDPSEVETVADYEKNPPVLQRRRLRLVRSAPSNTLTFEMRMPGGDWTPLKWDDNENRPAIDVWQTIQVSDGTLWIATPAGLVARTGDWRFNPNTFRLIEGVPGEAGRVITDLQIRGNEARLRYDGDSNAVYALNLDERQHPVRFAKLEGPDPFAGQSFDVDTRYWTWRLTGRIGDKPGSLVATWKEEPVRLDRGGFDFDTINSMAVFNGKLHLSTDDRGWFELPPGSAAMEQLSRPTSPAINPVDVLTVQSNRDPVQAALCLKDQAGDFVRLAPGGATARMQGCPVWAADAGFWRYLQDGATFSIVPRSQVSRAGERRLQDGRFSDEVVIGAPVGGVRDASVYTLVPTMAGVMSFDARGRTVDMRAPPFRGEGAPPRTLQWLSGRTPAYLSEGALYDLQTDEPRNAAWTFSTLPSGGTVEKLGGGPDRLLWADWSFTGRRHHIAIDPDSGSVLVDEFPIDGRTLYAYLRRGLGYAQQDAWVRLRLKSGRIEAFSGAPGDPLVMPLDGSFQMLAGVPRRSRTILVGPHEILELNMERIARHVYWNAPEPATGGAR
jgi:hypothetical protein